MNYPTVIAIGLIGGVAVGLQGPMAGAMSARIGPVATSLIIHLGGALASILLLLALRGETIHQWRSIPTPYLFAGICGLVLYITFSVTLPRIGVANAATLIIAGQMVLALLIDHFGWFGVPDHAITPSRLLGVGFLLLATYLISQ